MIQALLQACLALQLLPLLLNLPHLSFTTNIHYSAWPVGSTGRNSHGSAWLSAFLSQSLPSKTGFSSASTVSSNALLSPRLSTRKSKRKRLTSLRCASPPSPTEADVAPVVILILTTAAAIWSRQSKVQLHLRCLQPAQAPSLSLLQPLPVCLDCRRHCPRPLCTCSLLGRDIAVALVHVHARLDRLDRRSRFLVLPQLRSGRKVWLQ